MYITDRPQRSLRNQIPRIMVYFDDGLALIITSPLGAGELCDGLFYRGWVGRCIQGRRRLWRLAHAVFITENASRGLGHTVPTVNSARQDVRFGRITTWTSPHLIAYTHPCSLGLMTWKRTTRLDPLL